MQVSWFVLDHRTRVLGKGTQFLAGHLPGTQPPVVGQNLKLVD